MVASTLRPGRAPSCRRRKRPGPPPAHRDALVPAALAGLLLLAATVVAPERPQDQEAICQRHNGVDACRVW